MIYPSSLFGFLAAKLNMEIAGLIPQNTVNGLLNFKRETFQGISVAEFGDASVMKWSLLNEKNYRLMPTDVLIKVTK